MNKGVRVGLLLLLLAVVATDTVSVQKPAKVLEGMVQE